MSRQAVNAASCGSVSGLAAMLLVLAPYDMVVAAEGNGHVDHQAHQMHQAHQTQDHVPTLTDADRAEAFPDTGDSRARHGMHHDRLRASVLFEQLELRHGRHGRDPHWDMQAWVGYDFNRLWVRSEGHRDSETGTRGHVELLYGRAIAPWWDLVAGVRHDTGLAASRNYAAVGLQGVTPYRFEVRATAYLGESGRLMASFKVEYEMHLTRRFVVQPLFKTHWYARDDLDASVGSGLARLEGGLRFRYEIRRDVAPYLGVTREVARGNTAALVRASGRPARDTRAVAGIRFWF